MGVDYATRPGERPLATWRRMAWGRRALVALFAVPIVAAALGLLGLRHAEVESEAAGYQLRVRYPSMSRAGIASALDIYVTHEGGFGAPVTLRINHDYFTLFDLNGIYPSPSSENVDDGLVVWEFERPEGNVFRVHVDWRVQPSVHRGTSGHVELAVDDDFITEVDFDTRLAP